MNIVSTTCRTVYSVCIVCATLTWILNNVWNIGWILCQYNVQPYGMLVYVLYSIDATEPLLFVVVVFHSYDARHSRCHILSYMCIVCMLVCYSMRIPDGCISIQFKCWRNKRMRFSLLFSLSLLLLLLFIHYAQRKRCSELYTCMRTQIVYHPHISDHYMFKCVREIVR